MDLVNSIVKGVRIVDLLKSRGPLSYIEIFKQVELPKSTLFKILLTLETEELVRRDPDSGRYQLGVKLIEWGIGAQAQLEIRRVALPFMQDLGKSLNCTIHLTVVSHDEVLPIESYEPGGTAWPHYIFHGGVGIPAPLHATAPGKAILAFMDRSERERMLGKKGLKKFTENTLTDLAQLDASLQAIRVSCYAVSYAEHNEMVNAVATPIRDHGGKVFASLSALGIVSLITPERIPGIAQQMIQAANEISRLFGYNAGDPPRR